MHGNKIDISTLNKLKRCFDIMLGFILLLFASIPMICISALIKITSKGPVLYWSDRIGRHNSVFKMPKFRTMRIDTPELATHLLDDPEIYLTRCGKFLRKYSLDELPQLLSIINGNMSFVGPRPALFNQADLIESRTIGGIQELTPGLTGLAQINGRDSISIPEKVKLDKQYLDNRSFFLDLKILWLTALKVPRSEGVKLDANVSNNIRRDDTGMKLAISFFLVMLSVIFLYPDTPSGIGFTINTVWISAVKILFVITSVPILILIVKRRHLLRINALDFSIIATLLYLSGRGFLATETINEVGRIIVYVGLAIVVYYGVSIMVQNLYGMRVIFIFFTVIGVVISLYALLEFSMNKNLLYEGIDIAKNNLDYHRSGSTIAHPVILGLFLVQIAPFMIYLYVDAKTRLQTHLYLIAITILTLALGVTFSKSAWVTATAMIFAVIVWFIFNKPEPRRLILILFVSLGITFLAFNLSFSGSVDSATMSADRRIESFSAREYTWSLATPAFLEKPLFGFGMWQGGVAIASVELEYKGQAALDGRHAIDNLYLTTLVEQGIVGSLLILITIVLIFQNTFKLWRRKMGFEVLALPAFFSLIAVMVGGLFFDSLLVRQNLIIFLISAGILRALVEMQDARSLQILQSQDNLMPSINGS